MIPASGSGSAAAGAGCGSLWLELGVVDAAAALLLIFFFFFAPAETPPKFLSTPVVSAGSSTSFGALLRFFTRLFRP
eukprot:4177509-Karenia_brevis.AAC.1